MADFVFNIAKGYVAEFCNRVNTNDPTNSAIIVVPINATATDATMKDYDTLSALLGDANVTECTGSNWARKVITTISITVDDTTNDRVECDIADQTWTAVAASNDSTDLVFCYDSDTTGGTDANIIPLTCHDFAITTDGSDVTAQIADFFRAA